MKMSDHTIGGHPTIYSSTGRGRQIKGLWWIFSETVLGDMSKGGKREKRLIATSFDRTPAGLYMWVSQAGDACSRSGPRRWLPVEGVLVDGNAKIPLPF